MQVSWARLASFGFDSQNLKKKKIVFFLDFFSELVSTRPAYIANEIRGPQSARSNGTDLYLQMLYNNNKCHKLERLQKFAVNIPC